MEKTQPTLPAHDHILVTEYATPPMADLMKALGLFFMDAAGNAYLIRPPLYVFIKGNRLPENGRTAPTKRLFEPTGKFIPTNQAQRLIYNDELPLDLVPFGTIADEDGLISWPPEQDMEMSIVGFQECYRHALSVRVNTEPELVVKVVSLAGSTPSAPTIFNAK